MAASFALGHYDESARHILAHAGVHPRVGLILGSGLGRLAGAVENAVALPFADIPHFVASTVPGHSGKLVLGTLAGAPVCVMQGRVHYYEGYTLQQVTLPVRVMQRMGVRTLIISNAAGGLNPDFSVGDLMILDDHINFVGMAGHNPLTGPNLDEFGPRFPAANHIYSRSLRQLADDVAAQQGLSLRHGVYIMLSGPNFETPAEVRFLRTMGADAVGMSTVPEALVAHHAGMQVLGISTITNVAIDQLDAAGEPSHEEVQDAGHLITPRLSKLLLGILGHLAD